MEREMRAARTLGALFLAQMVGSFVVNFTLTKPLFGKPGFLETAAPHARQIGASALLGIAIGAIFLTITILAYPLFRPLSQRMALWFFGMGVVSLAVAVLEQSSVMSMVSLSQAYAQAAPAEQAQFQALRGVVASSRNWAHFAGRLTDGGVLLALYAMLFRFALVPRALAAVGLAASVLQMATLSLPFFGYPVMFLLLAPIGLCQLALVVWLFLKGFRDPGRI